MSRNLYDTPQNLSPFGHDRCRAPGDTRIIVMKLQGKRVLITGGSAGLGAAVALRFATAGAHIAINYAASKDRALSLQAELKRINPAAEIIVLQGDVSKSGVCSKLVEDTVYGLGGIDCIVSNAGWTKAAPWADLDALSEEEWDRTWAVCNPQYTQSTLRSLV